ncbi:MAG: GAF domain-containing protein [Spirochaetaceae bacterium]|nr:GAF domain-containing protein [Spirochaetaceae bacterium]
MNHARDEARPSLAELMDAYEDQRLLVGIGRDLITEKEPMRLLGLILDACRRITGADAGSIFLCETGDRGPLLRFKHSHTFSRDFAYEEFTMPRDERSIAGYVSLTGQVVNLPDVYEIDPALPYRFNRGYDVASGYRTKSMLVVPMRDHRGEIVGVIQLINSKETEAAAEAEAKAAPGTEIADFVRLETAEDFELRVAPFKRRYENLMEAVANQAAIALENALMVKRIEEQFEAFVHASISAIESRDPATSGHSERVARCAVALMKATDEEKAGRYGACSFGPADRTELEYAGLLHDFGKGYLDPRVFTKAKKLFERDYDCLVMRLKYLRSRAELAFARREADALREGRRGEAERDREDSGRIADALLEALDLVAVLNEPRETEADPEEAIGRLMAAAPPEELARDVDGSPLPLLTEEERRDLSIRRGTLNAEERRIIESHVRYTSAFVNRIPWPPELRGVPEYCAKHHEMLDGSGYPDGLRGDRIPLQARMLAVADIYDALAARDRPYKKALPFEVVRRIMEDEASRGRLDAELVRLFFERDCWKASEP